MWRYLNETLSDFCSSPFWDNDSTWNTSDPDFTICFEKTILAWLPCAFLWVSLPFQVRHVRSRKAFHSPFQLWNILKLVVIAMLALTNLLDMVVFLLADEKLAAVDISTPLTKFLTFGVFFSLTFANMKIGNTLSGSLFLFAFLLVFSGAPQFRTELRMSHRTFLNHVSNQEVLAKRILYLINYSLVVILFLLNCIARPFPNQKYKSIKEKLSEAEKSYRETRSMPMEGESRFFTKCTTSAKIQNVVALNFVIFFLQRGRLEYFFGVHAVLSHLTGKDDSVNTLLQNICPEMHSSFSARIFFSWCDKLVRKGYKHTFSDCDLWELDCSMRAATNAKKLESKWNHAQKRKQETQTKYKQEVPDENQRLLVSETRTKNATEVSLVRPLLEIHGKDLILAFSLRTVQQLLQVLATPLTLSLILMFLEDDAELEWHGYFYMSVLIASEIVQVPLFNHFIHINYRSECGVRAAVMTAIYKKALKISNSAKKNYATGEIVNLMAVDAQKCLLLLSSTSSFLVYLVQIFLCVYFLWNILGPCVLAGIPVVIIYVITSALITFKVQHLQKEQMKFKDKRNRLINEVLAGIKVLKLSAYEESFQRQIVAVRNKEIALLKEASLYNVGAEAISTLSSVLVPFVIFALGVLSKDGVELNPRNVFVSLSLFNTLRTTMRIIPRNANVVLQGAVAIKRIAAFLNSEELSRHAVTHERVSQPVIIKDGTFSWDGIQAKSILNGINLKVKSGSLVAVVGPVGSGKSSLLSAILGEMYKQSGFVNTTGRLAYVSQQAWIRNTTLKNNITFGDTTKSLFYDTIIETCALTSDLKVLPDGDRTEIGEKGMNLSGGQKQRVGLARAVYSDADIHLLDDPLSAVDSHVSKHIFEKVIGPNGLLKNKTRIFVTHNITYLSHVDDIFVLHDGSISEHGTYVDLLRKGERFASLVNELKNNEESSDEHKRENNTRNDRTTEEKLLPKHENWSNSNGITKVDRVQFKLTELEKREIGSIKLTTITYYLRAFGPFLIITTMVSIILCQAFSISADYWLSKWSSDAENLGHDNESKQRIYLSIYGFFGLGNVFSMIVHASALYAGMIRASKYIHDNLLISVLHWPVIAFDRIPCGRILNRFGLDVDIIDNLLPPTVLVLLIEVATVTSSFLVIAFNTPMVLSILLPSLAVYYVLHIFFSATSKQLKRMESISRSPIYSHFTDTVTGAKSIRAYDLQKKFIQESEEKIDTNIKCTYASWVTYRWFDVRVQILGVVIIFATCLFSLQAKDSISVAIVGLSITYSIQVTRDLYWSLFYAADAEMEVIAIERVKEYSEMEQEAPWIVPNVDGCIRESWPEKGDINFQNIEAKYHKNLEPVLRGITFGVQGGEKVGIVGRTGAGKSSLTLCLFRIIEVDEGSILIDGVDISQIGLHKLRSRVTIIPQDPVLFSGTLRMNLDPEEKCSDDEIWRALELVNLKTLVSGLRADLSHEVDEEGRNFSAGQRQLISLARAWLRKTKILVLDEATAAIDFETDKLIQITIRKGFKGCTVLTIAHRLNTILDYDRVMVLDRGRIVEFDSPRGLLESKRSMFYEMALEAGLV